VEDAENFDGFGADAVGDEVGSIGDYEFAGAGDAAGAAHGGIFTQKIRGAKNSLYEAVGCGGIVFGYIVGFRF
jgi:hypothetical protein